MVNIREANDGDRTFIFGLSPSLAEVAKLHWHEDATVQKFQDDYIAEMLNKTEDGRVTFIAEQDGKSLGFVHACEIEDGISGEKCGTIPLLAVSDRAQGAGVGQLLMQAAEDWSKAQGYRLLHLEVFANNDNAHGFYQKLGFQGETLVMIKPLDL